METQLGAETTKRLRGTTGGTQMVGSQAPVKQVVGDRLAFGLPRRTRTRLTLGLVCVERALSAGSRQTGATVMDELFKRNDQSGSTGS